LKYQVKHVTRYEYSELVTLSQNVARLRPRECDSQRCLSHQLTVTPNPRARGYWRDYFGNHTDYFALQQSHRELMVVAESVVEVFAPPAENTSASPSWEESRDELNASQDPRTIAAREFCFDSPHVAANSELVEYALPSFHQGYSLFDCALDLAQRIHSEFEFHPGATTVDTPIAEVLQTRRGVCQDFAHLQIGCMRSLGLAARYVSGYLVTTPPPGMQRLQGADVSHAWVSVFIPGRGWVDFDPTNGIVPSGQHVTVAWGRDYDDIGPIRGVLVGGRCQQLHVSVDVVPIQPEV
jgi:transglutaminase-like putative cysteine protease